MAKQPQILGKHGHAIPRKRTDEAGLVSDRPQPLDPRVIVQRAALAPESLRPADIFRLQRTLGNRAVGRLLSQPSPGRSLVQAKLTVNAPGDKYEQEADRVAEEVMQKPALQRAELKDEEDEEGDDDAPEVMTKPQPSPVAGGAFQAGEAFEQQLNAARGQGQALPPALKEEFEAKFGADFSGVRMHADARSNQLNRSIQAKAFTTGQDVFFRKGAYEPGSRPGQELIAHELTHVVQQSGGIQADTMIQRDVGFEFETDWGVHGGADPKKKSKPSLKKHHSYEDYGGFEVQVDEASRGIKEDHSKVGFEIEFVVKHHPETDEGGEKLKRTMKKLLEVVRWLERMGTEYHNFKLREPGEKLWVFPEAKDTAKDGKVQARAQATIGLSLSAIHEYGTIDEAELRKRYKEEQGYTGDQGFSVVYRSVTLQTYRTDFENLARNANKIKNNDLRGLITLLALYIYIFHDPTYDPKLEKKPKEPEDYAKGALPILAKTNFAAMFGHLGKKEQKKYRKDPDGFVDLVLEIVNGITMERSRVEKEKPVIPAHRVHARKHWTVGELTLKDWLKGIPKGEDKLTQQHYGELFGLGNLGGKEGEVGTGEKVDWITKKKAAMVLEFRSGALEGFLPPEKWQDFAFDYFHLVRRLHGSEDT